MEVGCDSMAWMVILLSHIPVLTPSTLLCTQLKTSLVSTLICIYSQYIIHKCERVCLNNVEGSGKCN